MKKIVVLALLILPVMLLAQTNILQLVWPQPPGYSSTLYTATNVSGTWTPMVTSAPPVSVTATQGQAFFYVVVTPTNQAAGNLSGSGDPMMAAPQGATYFDVDADAFWVNKTGDTNGWIQLI